MVATTAPKRWKALVLSCLLVLLATPAFSFSHTTVTHKCLSSFTPCTTREDCLLQGSSRDDLDEYLNNKADDVEPPTTSSSPKSPMQAAVVPTVAAPTTSIKASTTTITPNTIRPIASMDIFPRLPVWPVWMGVFIFLIGRINREWAAQLEDAVGGRVCPMSFFEDSARTSPFLLLVHHRHAFWNWDFIIRNIQRQFILPEGFPAHPHRGFTTLTYFIRGGFTHRDSMGVRQRYGQDNKTYKSNNQSNKKNHSTMVTCCQWLFTGAGVLHEEMFDLSFGSDQELFQLWVNVPARNKMDPPQVGIYEPPVVADTLSETIVLAGSYNNGSNNAIYSPASPVFGEDIFHVFVQPGGTWTYRSAKETVLIYVRKGGSLMIDGKEAPVHSMVTLQAGGDTIQLVNPSSSTVDCLVLMGNPYKNEPVAAQGSMVMNYQQDLYKAYQDYQYGKMGAPWDHALSDEEWRDHVEKQPCQYKYTSVVNGKD